MVAGVAFDDCGYRHLTKTAAAAAVSYTKVTITHEGRRRVVKIDGGSCTPFAD